ncbi:MAG: CinA family protein [Acholeplasmataceae bacterium]|jgi:PncC family amidohydrolase|nr:CinA family protein [Acholeplasmataceae bacterium]
MSALSVYKKCLDKGLTIAFAESMTGGACCYEMIKNPGASKVVQGGMIVYQNELKSSWLSVDPAIILSHGVVSPAVANHMAKQIANLTKASIGIGITGNAGPTIQDGTKLEAFISIIYQEKTHTIHLVFEDLNREEAILFTCDTVYQKLDELI